MTASLSQALLAFLLIVVAIPVVLVGLRRFRMFHPGGPQIIRLTGAVALGPRERIAVIEVGGRWLVVGVTGQSINLLSTLDSPPADLGSAALGTGLKGAGSTAGAAADLRSESRFEPSAEALAAAAAPKTPNGGAPFSRLLAAARGREAV